MSSIRNALTYIVVGSGLVVSAAWTGFLGYEAFRLIEVVL